MKFYLCFLLVTISILSQQGQPEAQAVLPLEEKSDSQIFFETGIAYLDDNNHEKAKEYLAKAAGEGDDVFAQRARIRLLQLKAQSGDEKLGSDLDLLNDKQRQAALFAIAEGYNSHAMNQKPGQRQRYQQMAQQYYGLLARQFPGSAWGQRSAIQVSQHLVQKKKFSQALDYLVPVLSTRNPVKSVPWGMAWFLLGSILENSKEHHDPYRALEAYKQVLAYKNSGYFLQARGRITHLRSFYHIYD